MIKKEHYLKWFSRILYLVIGVSFFLLFVLFSYLVHKDLFTQLDFDTTVRLQNNIPRAVDSIFSLLSRIGSFEVMSIVLVILVILRRKWLALGAFLFYVGFHLFEIYGKTFVEHFPPPQFMLRTESMVDFPQFHIRQENSYPSGHAGRAAFITVFVGVWILSSKKLSWRAKAVIMACLIAYDFIMFLSRVYLGEHWLSDVVGGALLGAGLSFLASVAL